MAIEAIYRAARNQRHVQEQTGTIACLVLHAAEAWRRKTMEYQESEDGAV